MFVEIAATVERNRQKASGGSATLKQSDLANTQTDLPGIVDSGVRKSAPNLLADERTKRSRENADSLDSKPNGIYQFELLRNEMIELEKRVQRSTDESVNERKYIDLVFGFLNGAGHLVRGDGRIHVSHKEKSPFYHWTLEEIADRCSLVLKQCVAFEKSEYPGYEKEGMF
ncbi:hypothetical protein Rs2_38675 [Raphanus sativus]|nr:hypothetical protein Rs2_38675 [Raphanus sativus]